MLEIAPIADGTLSVDLKGFHNPSKHFTALRLEEAKAKGIPLPTDPDEHTRVKDWNEGLPFQFSVSERKNRVEYG